jgi:hypothetical protein
VLTPARITRAKEFAQWTMETLFEPGGERIAIQVTTRLIRALMTSNHHEQATRYAAEAIAWLMLAPLHLTDEISIDPDPTIVTVREAAGYLGIKPRSVRTHIENCAGTKNELCTWLVKKGRGKGTAAMRLGDLVAWEETYWKPIRRKSARSV